MPININYSFNYGIALFIILFIQLGTGIILVFFYNNSDADVFATMNFIYIDIFFGNILRNAHCLGANLFFLFIYLHMYKSYFYTNNKNYPVITSGVAIFFLLCGIAFLGYVLP